MRITSFLYQSKNYLSNPKHKMPNFLASQSETNFKFKTDNDQRAYSTNKLQSTHQQRNNIIHDNLGTDPTL